jgi:hypothetical protein
MPEDSGDDGAGDAATAYATDTASNAAAGAATVGGAAFASGEDLGADVLTTGINRCTHGGCVLKPALTLGTLLLLFFLYSLISQCFSDKKKLLEDKARISKGPGAVPKPPSNIFRRVFEAGGITKLGWVLPFSLFCAYITGVMVQLDTMHWLGKADNTANKYLSSLLSFLVVFRFNQLYSRVLMARQHVQNLTTALRQTAMLLRAFWVGNMDSAMFEYRQSLPDEMTAEEHEAADAKLAEMDTWSNPVLEKFRRKVGCRIVLFYTLCIHQLSEGYAVCTLDSDMTEMVKELRTQTLDDMTDDEMNALSKSSKSAKSRAAMQVKTKRNAVKVKLAAPVMYSRHTDLEAALDKASNGEVMTDLRDRMAMRGAVLETATLLETDLTTMANMKLYEKHMAQYGQLTVQINKAVDSFQLAEQITDVFPGNHGYPPTMSFLARFVLIYFCLVTCYIISTLHEPKQYINAMVMRIPLIAINARLPGPLLAEL